MMVGLHDSEQLLEGVGEGLGFKMACEVSIKHDVFDYQYISSFWPILSGFKKFARGEKWAFLKEACEKSGFSAKMTWYNHFIFNGL